MIWFLVDLNCFHTFGILRRDFLSLRNQTGLLLMKHLHLTLKDVCRDGYSLLNHTDQKTEQLFSEQ